jgi:hypothetical protein
LAALMTALVLSLSSTPTWAQPMAMVDWAADLKPAKAPPRDARALMVQTPATAKVTVDVDDARRTLIFHVTASHLSGVDRIELRTVRPQDDFAGPTVFTIYDHRDGPFTGSLTRTVSGPAFASVAAPILNSQAGVVISTDANPDGELAGKILMHKHYH